MATHFKASGLCVSKMSGKLEGIRALNTNTLSNPMCKKWSKNPKMICHYCYSINMLNTFRRCCVKPWESNSGILSTSVLPVVALPKFKKDKLFRFSAHGELINLNHLKNYMNIAEKNPNTFFGFWTKRTDLLKRLGKAVPKNINMIYSTPCVDVAKPRVPEGFNKVFSAYTAEFAKKNRIKINCHGNCTKCKICYTRNRTRFVNEIIKSEQ